jgi:hypothetical protein
LASLERLAPVDVSAQQASDGDFADAEFDLIAGGLPAGPGSKETDAEAAGLIPRRLSRGPITADMQVTRLDEAGRDAWWQLNQRIGKEASRTVPALAQYWADGQRSVAEIGQLVALETGCEATQLLVAYFRFLERLGLVALDEGG